MKPKYSFFLPFFLFACKNSGVGTNKNDNPETQFLGQLTEVNRRNGTQSDFDELADNFKGSFSLPNYVSISRKICDVGYANEPETLLYVCTAWMDNGSIDKFEAQHIFRDLSKTHEDNYHKFLEYIKRLNFDEQNPNAQSLIDLLIKTGTREIPHISLQAIGVPPIAKTEIIPDAITIDDIQDFGQWVRFINQKNENIDITVWNKGKELVQRFGNNGPKLFNESVCLINTNVVFSCSGNEIVNSISDQVQLTNASLKAISSFIPDGQVVDSAHLQPLLSLCTKISEFNPLFQKCVPNVIDVDVLDCLISCQKSNLGGFDGVLQSIDAGSFATTCIGNKVLDTIMQPDIKKSKVRFCKDSCDRIFGMIQGGKEITKADKLVDFLVDHVKTDVSSLDVCVNKFVENEFSLDCLTALCRCYENSFVQVINKISDDKFFANYTGDQVIAPIVAKDQIRLDGKSLPKILRMINDGRKITVANVASLMKFIVNNLANIETIDTVFGKYAGGKFDFNCLKILCSNYADNFVKVINKVNTFAKYQCQRVIALIIAKPEIKLDGKSLPKILRMTNNKKIAVANVASLMTFIVNNLANIDNIDTVFAKYDGGAFDLDCLKILCTDEFVDSFNKVIGQISPGKFVTNCSGDQVITPIVAKDIELDGKSLPKILRMIEDGQKITVGNVANLMKFIVKNLANVKTIDTVFDKYDNGAFDLACLTELCTNHTDSFSTVIGQISDDKFAINCNGDQVITPIVAKEDIKLDNVSLPKILSMIGVGTITVVDDLSKFLLTNIQKGKSDLYKSVLEFYKFDGGVNVGNDCTGKVSLALIEKFTASDDTFKIVESIPAECFKFEGGNKGWPIDEVFGKLGNVKLDPTTTWPKISSMIVNNNDVSIWDDKKWEVFAKALVPNFVNFIDLSSVINKINGGKVGTGFLRALAKFVWNNGQNTASDVFCNVFKKISSFEDNLNEHAVLNCFAGTKIKLNSETFDTVTKMCKKDSTNRNYNTLKSFLENNIATDIPFDKIAQFFTSAYVEKDSFTGDSLNFVFNVLNKCQGFSLKDTLKHIAYCCFCGNILSDFLPFLSLNASGISYSENSLFRSWFEEDKFAFLKMLKMCSPIQKNFSNDIRSLPIKFLWFLALYYKDFPEIKKISIVDEFLKKADKELLGMIGKKADKKKAIIEKISEDVPDLYEKLQSRKILPPKKP